jgi:transposase
MRKPKQHKLNDLSRSLTTLDAHHTLIAVIEMSLSSWVVAGIVPGVERQPLKKLDTDENALLKLLDRWRKEAERAGHKIRRIAVAFEAGRDGFWLARWLKARGIEIHVIHASSVAVSREHRRARYAGLTASPDESGKKRCDKGLARSGNARVRRGMIQLAWRFLMFQKDSALAQWYRARTENARGTRKTMIVALARKLLIALWHFVRDGVVPEGVVLRPAQ